MVMNSLSICLFQKVIISSFQDSFAGYSILGLFFFFSFQHLEYMIPFSFWVLGLAGLQAAFGCEGLRAKYRSFQDPWGHADRSVSRRDPGLGQVLTNFGNEGTITKFRLFRIFRGIERSHYCWVPVPVGLFGDCGRDGLEPSFRTRIEPTV